MQEQQTSLNLPSAKSKNNSFVLQSKYQDSNSSIHKSNKQLNVDQSRPAGKPMTAISSVIMQECDNQNHHQERYRQMTSASNPDDGKREFLLAKKKKNDVSYSNINRANQNNRESEEFFKNVDLRRKQSNENVSNGQASNLQSVRSHQTNRSFADIRDKPQGNVRNMESKHNEVSPSQSRLLSRKNSRHMNNPNINVDIDLTKNRSNPAQLTDQQADKEFKLNARNEIKRDVQIDMYSDHSRRDLNLDLQFDTKNLYNINDLVTIKKNNGNSSTVNRIKKEKEPSYSSPYKFSKDINRVAMDSKQTITRTLTKGNTSPNIHTYNADLSGAITDNYKMVKSSIIKDKLLDKNKGDKSESMWGGIRAIDANKNDEERKEVLKMQNEQNKSVIDQKQRDKLNWKESKKNEEFLLIQEQSLKHRQQLANSIEMKKKQQQESANIFKMQKDEFDTKYKKSIQRDREMDKVHIDNVNDQNRMTWSKSLMEKSKRQADYRQTLHEQTKYDNVKKIYQDLEHKGI